MKFGVWAAALGSPAVHAAPARDYAPAWRAIPALPEQRDVRLTDKSVVPISRLVPEQPYVLSEPVKLSKDLLPAGTILVQIEQQPLTACEMVRPPHHESFACLVDRDGDGRFDGTYRLFSNSFFMLAAWSNRLPQPITPTGYKAATPDTLPDYVELTLALGTRRGRHWTFMVRPQSLERSDYWVDAGQLVIGPEDVGHSANIRGSHVIVKAVDDMGVTVDIIPPSTAATSHFTIQKDIYKSEGPRIIPWE